jgi:hypothetical protein
MEAVILWGSLGVAGGFALIGAGLGALVAWGISNAFPEKDRGGAADLLAGLPRKPSEREGP